MLLRVLFPKVSGQHANLSARFFRCIHHVEQRPPTQEGRRGPERIGFLRDRDQLIAKRLEWGAPDHPCSHVALRLDDISGRRHRARTHGYSG